MHRKNIFHADINICPYIIGRENIFSSGYLCSHVPSTLLWTPRPRRLDVPWARKTLSPPKIFKNVYILSLGYGCGVTAILAHEAVAMNILFMVIVENIFRRKI